MIDLAWHEGRRLRFAQVNSGDLFSDIWHSVDTRDTAWFRLQHTIQAGTPVERRWQVSYSASPLIGIGSTAQSALDDLHARMLAARKSIYAALEHSS